MLQQILHLFKKKHFTITISNGRISVTKGDINNRITSDFKDIIKARQIKKGTIYGIKEGNNISIFFSNSIPESSHQRFRNTFGIYR